MKKIKLLLLVSVLLCIGLLAGCDQAEDTYQFKTSELEKYVIIYDQENLEYFDLALKLSEQISDKYGVMITPMPDIVTNPSEHEILLGDTSRDDLQSKVMEYSVTVAGGKFRINAGGVFSAEKAVEFLCKNVFNGKELTLDSGTYYPKVLMTDKYEVTDGTTARIMSANVLADAFAEDSVRSAHYRAEIFAGMLVASTPDVVGLQEVDETWDEVLDAYLEKIQKVYGITYTRCLETYEGKLNYTSFLYRSDKFRLEKSGMDVFSWWSDSTFKHNYHMRNLSWVQLSSLENPGKRFIVANTHWSYRTEHADGKTYLSGSTKPIVTDELRTQCKNETNTFLTALRQQNAGVPVFVTGDFNTSLSFFTDSGWTPSSFKLISQEAQKNGTSVSSVPVSGHFDHLFGAGNYTVSRFEILKDVNYLDILTDHPLVYADLAF